MKNKESIFQEFMKKIGVEIPWSTIDEVVVSDANVLRPVKGHAFEVLFDEIVHRYLKCSIKHGPGGDTDIDRIVLTKNRKTTLQIKTISSSTVFKKVKFGVSLHKTHGEEKRPRNLYPIKWPCPYCPHDGEEFPDFLIVLHPGKGVLIIPKNEIPQSKTFKGHYADPAIFPWDSEWLNRWDLLGFPQFKGRSLERRTVSRQQKLPRIANIVKLTDYEIVKMWMEPENFRTLEMNLKGNLREPAIEAWLKKFGIKLKKPEDIAYPKYDRVTEKGTRIQIKGPSKGLCSVERKIVGVEVMGSHRKGADRMYSDKDFDYLGFVIDPQFMPKDIGLDRTQYHFCLIPLQDLPLHYRNKQWGTDYRIYPICKFFISEEGKKPCLKPFTNYIKRIFFRKLGPWYIDELQYDI